MEFREKVAAIQREIKAPKNLYNSFGKYKYRNAEGILEAFKQYEEKYKVFLTVSDDLMQVGDRIYIKAIATLSDCESDGCITTQAFAREPESKKGMDESQITGTASSYARKYALNGLLLLDDTKDPDTDEYHKQTSEHTDKIDAAKVKTLIDTAKEKHIGIQSLCAFYGKQTVEELTTAEWMQAMKKLESK